MFRIQSVFGQPLCRPAQHSREPASGGRFGSSQEFSVRDYQQFNVARVRAFLPDAVRTFGRSVGRLMRYVLDAMHESRCKQAKAVLDHYGHLLDTDGQARLPVSQKPAGAREGKISFRASESANDASYGMRIRCSITGAPCEGDRAHLCIEWGCARKGGISPISTENA